MAYTPHDYKNPEWDNANRVHNWRNYISEELRDCWQSFGDTQKAMIARNADDAAGREHWD